MRARGIGTWWGRAALLVCGLVAGCSGQTTPASGKAPAAAGGAQTAEWFTEQAKASGLDFTHFNGASGRYYYPEILGPGVALFDYDNDGDLDVFVTQGRMLGPVDDPAKALVPPADPSRPGGRLFRNDLRVAPDGTRTLHFTDVTASSGIKTTQYGLGVAAGDYDNDGFVDLFLTNFGTNQLFHNNGDGTFTDVTEQVGLKSQPGVAVSAAFVDYDRDGWLDLYVAYNVNYQLDREQVCPNSSGVRDYCPPQIYGGRPDHLYRNLGNGRFVDVSDRALVGGKFGPALGVTAADFNGDGWPDIFVANDGEPDLLWINQRDGTFREMGLQAGVAVTADGQAEASMGVDAADFDNDGDDDLVETELTTQGFNLYVNDGSARFTDASAASGIGPLSQQYTGWGTNWIDFDNDGWLDLLSVNGPIVRNEGQPGVAWPYGQRKLLFRNRGGGKFENVTDKAGAVFQLLEAGRGAAFGDIDNDGDIDVVVGNDNGPIQLLLNQIGSRNHWLGLRLTGSPTRTSASGGPARDRDMLGAEVTVVRPDGTRLRRRAKSGASYGSANDPRVLVGLGTSSGPVQVEIRWPDGKTETRSAVGIDRWITLREGGQP